jgi:hypothetical protein
MNESIKKLQEDLVHAYYDGVNQGLWRHAWWKDGEQYVGNMGTTLKEAQAKADAERRKELAKLAN